jgi:hypothetical protein
MASYPDVRKIWITEFLFENRLHWQLEVETNFYRLLFHAASAALF